MAQSFEPEPKVKLQSLVGQTLARPVVHVVTLSGPENVSVLVAMSWKKRVNSVSMSVMTVMEGALSVV
jgi:hypothetical protein